MTRPTPEQIAAEAPFPADRESVVAALERLAFLARLTSNGYVIVHPDDPIPVTRIHLDDDCDILAHIKITTAEQETP